MVYIKTYIFNHFYEQNLVLLTIVPRNSADAGGILATVSVALLGEHCLKLDLKLDSSTCLFTVRFSHPLGPQSRFGDKAV